MEKKVLIALIFIAATSLLWVFHFMGRESQANPFVQKGNTITTDQLCQKDSAPAEILTVLKPGFAVHENTHTSYVLRSDEPGVGAESVEKVRLVIEQPTEPRPAATECEQRKIEKLRPSDEPYFSIETLKVLPSKEWPEEYEFLYQRWRGTWSDLEAFRFEPVNSKSHTNWGVHSPDAKTPPSI